MIDLLKGFSEKEIERLVRDAIREADRAIAIHRAEHCIDAGVAREIPAPRAIAEVPVDG